ncbi:hypothetical protein AnigIFM63309_011664 [Aspergillus niger]|nr:hypothetical protein AnigIFM63309_011664 [Aspergillus niger]
MLQRGGIYFMRNALSVLQGLYDETEPSIHEADLYSGSLPIPAQSALGRTTTKHLAERDKELLDNLNKAGFKVDFGYDGSGVLRKALTRGLVLYNGVELEADIVVFDTGYHRMKTTARQTFGDAVASRFQKEWDLDEEGEINAVSYGGLILDTIVLRSPGPLPF